MNFKVIKKQFVKDFGFSLVQVIIAMGLLSGIVASAFKILQQQVKIGKNSSEDFEAIYVVDEINTILSNPRDCGLNLKNRFSLEDSVEELSEYQGDTKVNLYKVGTSKNLLKAGLILDEILIDGNGDEFSPQLGQTLLKLKFSKIDNVSKKIEKAIPIHIVENNSGKIENCFSLGGLTELTVGSYKSPWEKDTSNYVFATGKKIVFDRKRSEYPEDIILDKGLISTFNGKVICNEKKAGAFYYFQNKKLFRVCNGKKWIELDPTKKQTMLAKDYTFTSRTQGKKLFKISGKWKHCSLKKYAGSGGECSVSTIDQISDMTKWEATILKSRGKNVSCSFTCIR